MIMHKNFCLSCLLFFLAIPYSYSYSSLQTTNSMNISTLFLPIILKNKNLLDYLRRMKDPRKEAILKFHEKYQDKIEKAKGSRSKHQAWEGGYVDHLTETFTISEIAYQALGGYRELPFTLESAFVVLYFHDMEKIWKYTSGEEINKKEWYDEKLPTMGIIFTKEERNALKYIHGEGHEDYNPHTRKMNELAAFCHMADNLSARLWYDKGRRAGKKGSLFAR